jgi:hypothetical protein
MMRKTPALQRTIPLPQERSQSEDDIKLESLKVLATCDHYYLREVATNIFRERFMANGPALQQLLRDMESQDDAVRERALKAYDFLEDVPIQSPRRALSNNGAADERELRRRRRGAVIIHEGDRPVSQRDVYMPTG